MNTPIPFTTADGREMLRYPDNSVRPVSEGRYHGLRRVSSRMGGLIDGYAYDPVSGKISYARSHGGSDGYLTAEQRREAFEKPHVAAAIMAAERKPYDYWREGGPASKDAAEFSVGAAR